MTTIPSAIPSAVLALAAALPAQVAPLAPFPRTLDLLVADSGADAVWRLADFAQDGDYLGAGEVLPFYDDVLGGIALTNPTCIALGPGGTAYVADSTEDIVLALIDRNGDGDALDPGEHAVFFDAGNLSGVVMASAQGIAVDALGAVYVATSNTSTSGNDAVLRLFDLDQDGDANDAGEASQYCVIPGGAGSTGNSIPTKVIVGPDASLYYAEVGSTGAVQKGVWRLTDLNFDGDCNDPGEVTLFWTPPAPLNPFYWGLAVDHAGNFYVTDHGNETVWRARDADLSGAITAGEETLFYQTAGSTWWDVIVRGDGSVLLCEDEAPDRLTALRDLNADGDALDPGESAEVYSEAVSATAVKPRAAAFQRAPSLVVQPPAVPIGQQTAVVATAARPGDFVLVAISLATVPPAPLPPLGALEIDLNLAATMAFAFAGAAGQFALPVPVPANPGLVGTYAFQVLAGDPFRPFLSNGAALTVTP